MRRETLIVIGAGPTGLGAAHRCIELLGNVCLVLEASSHPGGLASSYLDDAGFTWDLGSHLQFSHSAQHEHIGYFEISTELWVDCAVKFRNWFRSSIRRHKARQSAAESRGQNRPISIQPTERFSHKTASRN